MYVVGCVGAVPLLVGRAPSVAVLVFAFLAALATYLLDRVKMRDADLDPADAMAHPARADYVERHSVVLRLLVLASAVSAIGLALVAMPLASLLVPASLGGVLYYARSRERYSWRPKDVLQLKNASVAVAITAFALALDMINQGVDWRDDSFVFALPGGFLLLLVFADAMVCDLDDRHADERFGTRTVPVHFGNRHAALLAVGTKCVASLLLFGMLARGAIAGAHVLPWCVGPLALTLVVLWAVCANRRDWIDLSLAPVLICSWTMLAVSPVSAHDGADVLAPNHAGDVAGR